MAPSVQDDIILVLVLVVLLMSVSWNIGGVGTARMEIGETEARNLWPMYSFDLLCAGKKSFSACS